MGHPSKEQVIDQPSLQEQVDLDPIETSLDADTPSITNNDNNPDFENLQAHSEESDAQLSQDTTPDQHDPQKIPVGRTSNKYFEVVSRKQGVRIIKNVSLAETIEIYYKNLDLDLACYEQLKLKTLRQKIHRSYYAYWRINANLVMRQLVALKARKKKLGIKA